MLQLWQDILQEIKRDVRHLIYLTITINLLTTIILAVVVAVVLYYLMYQKKKCREMEWITSGNVPGPPPPSPVVTGKRPVRPVSRDLVEAVAQRAVKIGYWKEFCRENNGEEMDNVTTSIIDGGDPKPPSIGECQRKERKQIKKDAAQRLSPCSEEYYTEFKESEYYSAEATE